MKRILLLLLLCVGGSSLLAQGLKIGVVVPEQAVDGIEVKTWDTLANRLQRSLDSAGAISTFGGDIALLPTLTFITDEIIEGGMRSIYKVELELTVSAVQFTSGTNFGSITYALSGNGYSRSEAVKAAVLKVRPNDPNFNRFYSDIKTKISDYFRASRSNILAKARSMAATKDYEGAIALLYSYPEGVEGYEEMQVQLRNVYKQYAADNCKQIIQQARSKYAVKKYDEAADLLATLEGSTPCNSEAKQLSEQIRKAVNQDLANERQERREVRNAAVSIEKARLNAYAQVASAYYKSHKSVVYQHVHYGYY